LARLQRPDRLAGQDQIHRLRDTDQLGKPLRPAGAGNEAELYLRLPELGPAIVEANRLGARQRQPQPAPGSAVDGGDHRLALAGVSSRCIAAGRRARAPTPPRPT